MNLAFTFTPSAMPLYAQLYAHIRDEIRHGKLPAGQKMPAKRKLADYLGISLHTVETAYEQLAAEGYIRAVPRSGSYVSNLEDPLHIPLADPLKTVPDEEPGQTVRFDLSTNQVSTDFFPFATWSRLSREVLLERSQELLRLPHPQGDPALRQNLADYLHEFRGVSCRPDQLIIGAGTEYLMALATQILGPDRIFAVENPGYRKTSQVLAANRTPIRPVGLDIDGISISQLEQSGADVVHVTPSHQFPLGIIMPVSRRLQLIRWASQDNRRYIIEDDYDSEFRFGGRPVPALQGLDTHGQVIYLGTFSKSLAPSIRISYLVLPPRLLAIYQQQFSFYSSTVSRMEQAILQRFIQKGHFERHLNRMRLIYRERKNMMTAALTTSPYSRQIAISSENTGLHLLLRIKNGLSEIELVERAKAAGIKLQGLSAYYAAGTCPPDERSSTLVISYANLDASQIRDSADILFKAWFRE